MRKVIAISLLIGLLFTFSTSYATMSKKNISEESITLGLCTGIDRYEDVTLQQKTGTPFSVTKKTVEKVPTCSEPYSYPYDKMTELKNYLMSWQFFANWIIWTLPPLGIGYVLHSRSKRRHQKITDVVEHE